MTSSDKERAAVIASLQKDKAVAEELLLLTLVSLGEPVVLDLAAAREVRAMDWAIDVRLNEEEGICTLQVVSKDDEPDS